MSLATDLATMKARQTKARADYHYRTKDERGNFAPLGDHGRRWTNFHTGFPMEVVCGCVECSP